MENSVVTTGQKTYLAIIKGAVEAYNKGYLPQSPDRLRMFFRQAFRDLPHAATDGDRACKFLQTNYGVKEENTVVLHGEGYARCKEAYADIKDALATEKARTLYIHVLAGHGSLQNGLLTLLINEADTLEDGRGQFYKRLAVEEEIRHLADCFPGSYHLALFDCCRSKEYSIYNYVSAWEAFKFTDARFQELYKV